VKLQRRSAAAGCLSETVVAGDPHTGGQAGAATPAEDALHLELGNVFGNARQRYSSQDSGVGVWLGDEFRKRVKSEPVVPVRFLFRALTFSAMASVPKMSGADTI
jgi:hypothetical protein